MQRPRIVLYGHDSLGLGHLRRNLALAASMVQHTARPDVLVMTGTSESLAFPVPDGVDLAVMPAIAKGPDGRYGSRRLSLPLESLVKLRRSMATAMLDEFEPDLLVVDKLPLGFGGELVPALGTLRRRGRTKVVLGLRDVLDAPAAARREWRDGRMSEAVRRYFDEIWVYGDPSVHDLVDACGLPPSLQQMVRYVGYLANGRVDRPDGAPLAVLGDRYALCMVGGGSDGFDLARTFSETTFPEGIKGAVAVGSQMADAERAQLCSRAANRPDLTVLPFRVDLARLMAGADAVVTMGGYNSMAEVMATDVPALVVPRRRPRREQLVRASALAARGHVDMLAAPTPHPDHVGRWLSEAVRRPRHARHGINLDGLAEVRDRTAKLLTTGVSDAVSV